MDKIVALSPVVTDLFSISMTIGVNNASLSEILITEITLTTADVVLHNINVATKIIKYSQVIVNKLKEEK